MDLTLKDKLTKQKNGLLFYGLTPPKANTDTNKVREIAGRQIERINGLPIDGLILYDIQDESSRTNEPRPFPYLPTMAPDSYSEQYLNELKVPRVIYKSVGKWDKDSFSSWIQNSSNGNCYVFVGAPSKDQKTSLTLGEAYKIYQKIEKKITLGGVTIPERHMKHGNEHLRLNDKTENGCSFFISQCVYNVNNAKNFLSDYYDLFKEKEKDFVPIIFTLTPCGSKKTLQFMNWLGIDIPQSLKDKLMNSDDILGESIKVCKAIATELYEYCSNRGMPIGFNIESVAIRKVEIEASIDLLKYIKEMLGK
ncbi:methylenetetrahydrofolate reductase [Echinicola jeungdonensis]|uniref:Methylenetetrahydrofolate reductase n=1 Tax=Echinicola jeungdonensis TaxID=709343 RepID=A0ABV5J8K6_9BACT|nr:methylenetetrahydrofolate reductase [Echinicola jeungdonensis]MDN3669395.1 methylenetetrahydrofolate reductase [Echinicola jeungdonensis]